MVQQARIRQGLCCSFADGFIFDSYDMSPVMHIELAVDAMELADHIDEMVLFSGDGDFRSLVEAVQRRGVRVTVVSTISSQPPMIADELRRQADAFVDLIELQPRIARSQSERRSRDPQSQIAS